MTPSKAKVAASTREWPRFSHLKDIFLNYEGRSEVLAVHPPDISPKGMFINTMTNFPEGTILKLSFRLARSNHLVDVRCEVRFCLPGAGVGVEFFGLTQQDEKAIEDELQSHKKRRARSK